MAAKKSKQKRAEAKNIQPVMQIAEKLAAETLRRRKVARTSRKAALARIKPPARMKGVALAKGGEITSAGTLIAEGDSWFDYPFHDVLKDLEDDHGYDVESVAHRGDRVEDMAYSGGQLDEFARRIDKVIRNGTVPKAILLSGGGNDIAGEQFGLLLNHARSSIAGLNESVVSGIIDQRVFEAYVTIIKAVTTLCEAQLGQRVPILVHGYDYAVPDGRGYQIILTLAGPWLEPGFREKGYMAMTQRQPLVNELIDRFNRMLANIARLPDFRHVTYVDLRNTLPNSPKAYENWWDNELHPTKKGFEAVTKKFVDALP